MTKRHYILISILITLSVIVFILSKTDETLKGTWIGEYSTNIGNPHKFKAFFAEQSLLTFKNKRCYLKGSKRTYGNEIIKSNYMLFSDFIIFDDLSYDVIVSEHDSLVIKSSGSAFSQVYRKLSESLKHHQNIKLIGKKFHWKNQFFQDTIYFITDSTFIRASSNHLSKTSPWERINYEGFDIIFMDGDVPYLIENKKGKIINLRTFHQKTLEHSMTELE